MKKWILLICITVLSVNIGALELGAYFDIGNMSFPDTPLTTTTFPSTDYPWGITVEGKETVGEGMSLDFGYTNDRVLNHLVHATFGYEGEFFSIGAGPAFGVFNSSQVPLQSGMVTAFKISWPGRLFLSFDMFSSIGNRLSTTGDYSQAKNDLALGFYVTNAICTVEMNQKTYTEIVATYGEGTERQTDYAFKIDIFQKNIPFRVKIGVIYRQKTKQYITSSFSGTNSDISDTANFDMELSDDTITETLNSVLLQTKITFNFTDNIAMVLDAYSNLFSFGKIINDAADTSQLISIPTTLPESFLFEAQVGFTINLE